MREVAWERGGKGGRGSILPGLGTRTGTSDPPTASPARRFVYATASQIRLRS